MYRPIPANFFFLTGVNDTMTQSFCKVIIMLRFISTVLFTVWAEGISKSGVFLRKTVVLTILQKSTPLGESIHCIVEYKIRVYPLQGT